MKVVIFVFAAMMLCNLLFLVIKSKKYEVDKGFYEKEIKSLENRLRFEKMALDSMKTNAISINRWNADLQNEINALKSENYNLMVEIKQYQVVLRMFKPKITQETIEAVKYAMKKAHPDNGGSADDFMKFKECYEELIGKF